MEASIKLFVRRESFTVYCVCGQPPGPVAPKLQNHKRDIQWKRLGHWSEFPTAGRPPGRPVAVSAHNKTLKFNEVAEWIPLRQGAPVSFGRRKKKCTCLPCPLQKLLWHVAICSNNLKIRDSSEFIYNKTWKASCRPWQWRSGQWLQVLYVAIHI